MPIIIYIFLLVCSVFFSGCDRASELPQEKVPEKRELGSSEIPEKSPEKGAHSIIKVANLTAEEKALALDYQVTNPFPCDIWICEDIDIQSECPVEIRIDAETVHFKLTFKLQRNMLRDPPAYGKYRRLLSGESHSGRALLDLPIRNISPVYDFHEYRRSRKPVVLHRAVFVIGYFEGGPISRLRERIGTLERGYDTITLNEVRRTDGIIVEETQDDQSREMLYLTCLHPSLSTEKSTEVIITDVNVPCSVVVDDK